MIPAHPIRPGTPIAVRNSSLSLVEEKNSLAKDYVSTKPDTLQQVLIPEVIVVEEVEAAPADNRTSAESVPLESSYTVETLGELDRVQLQNADPSVEPDQIQSDPEELYDSNNITSDSAVENGEESVAATTNIVTTTSSEQAAIQPQEQATRRGDQTMESQFEKEAAKAADHSCQESVQKETSGSLMNSGNLRGDQMSGLRNQVQPEPENAGSEDRIDTIPPDEQGNHLKCTPVKSKQSEKTLQDQKYMEDDPKSKEYKQNSIGALFQAQTIRQESEQQPSHSLPPENAASSSHADDTGTSEDATKTLTASNIASMEHRCHHFLPLRRVETSSEPTSPTAAGRCLQLPIGHKPRKNDKQFGTGADQSQAQAGVDQGEKVIAWTPPTSPSSYPPVPPQPGDQVYVWNHGSMPGPSAHSYTPPPLPTPTAAATTTTTTTTTTSPQQLSPLPGTQCLVSPSESQPTENNAYYQSYYTLFVPTQYYTYTVIPK